MSLSKQVLHDYVRETAGTGLTDESIDQLSTAIAALDTVASDTLFGTEPEQLHSLLDELGNGKDG